MLGELVCEVVSLELDDLVLSLTLLSPFPLWWLVLFIEALVLFPNIEREGIPQRPSLKRDS